MDTKDIRSFRLVYEERSINQAAKQCKCICKQIRNKLLKEVEYVDRNTQINGIGPIGDNFYGTVLTFFLNVPEDYIIDENFFL